MIPKPMQVYPQNCDCDMTVPDNLWRFTFYGDNLTHIFYRFSLAKSGEYVTDTYVIAPVDLYNGEEMTIYHDPADGIFHNGNDYKYKIVLFQEEYNIPVIRGRIRGSNGNSVIYIPYGVTNIVDPYTQDGVIVGGMYMEINGEQRMVMSVDWSEIVLDNGESVMAVTVDSPYTYAYEIGYTYKLYANFMPSGEFFFRARKNPSVTVSAGLNDITGFADCTATYSQENRVELKCVQWSLYHNDILVQQSDLIYSGRLRYTFTNCFKNGNYRVDCKITTQGDVNATSSATLTRVGTAHDISNLVVTEINGNAQLTWQSSKTLFNIYRDDLYLGTTSANSYTDKTAPNRVDCTYSIVPIGCTLASIQHKQDSMILHMYALSYNSEMYGVSRYNILSQLDGKLSPMIGDITNNTGSLNFVLGDTLGVFADVAHKYKSDFDKFLSLSEVFMIKDPSGNALIVTITSVSYAIDNEASVLPCTVTINYKIYKEREKIGIL